MLKEFEKLTNTRIDPTAYSKIIEPAYMECELTKEEFVKEFDWSSYDLNARAKHIAKMIKRDMQEYEKYRYCDSADRELLRAKIRSYVKAANICEDDIRIMKAWEYYGPEGFCGCQWPVEIRAGAQVIARIKTRSFKENLEYDLFCL